MPQSTDSDSLAACGVALLCKGSVTVRIADVADLKSLSSFARPLLSEWTYGLLLAKAQLQHARFFVQFCKATIVGTVLLHWVCDTLEIIDFVVSPDRRGQRLGTLLLESVLCFARRHQVNRIFLEVRNDNIAAKAMYRRAGFVKTGVRKKYYADHMDALTLTWYAPTLLFDEVKQEHLVE